MGGMALRTVLLGACNVLLGECDVLRGARSVRHGARSVRLGACACGGCCSAVDSVAKSSSAR